MKKTIILYLLAIILVGGSSCAQAQSSKEKTASESSAKTSTSIAEFCSALDQVMTQLEKDPSKLQNIGEMIDKKVDNLNKDQKLTAADKATLKKTMGKMVKVIVQTQLKQTPELANALGSMTEDQKKEVMDMALKTATEEIDKRIDACNTIGDFINVANQQ